MHEVSVFRLYVLRAMYLFIVVGLGVFLWPEILNPERHWALAQGESTCMLAAFSLLCLLGFRYPLQMLPVLLWETVWKTLWLLLVPFAQWRSGHIDEALQPTVFACSMVILVYLAIPWGYIYSRYVKADGDRWRGPTDRTKHLFRWNRTEFLSIRDKRPSHSSRTAGTESSG